MFRSPEIIHENSLLQLLAVGFLPFMGLFFDFVISIPTFTKFTKYSTIGNPKFGHLKTIKIWKKCRIKVCWYSEFEECWKWTRVGNYSYYMGRWVDAERSGPGIDGPKSIGTDVPDLAVRRPLKWHSVISRRSNGWSRFCKNMNLTIFIRRDDSHYYRRANNVGTWVEDCWVNWSIMALKPSLIRVHGRIPTVKLKIPGKGFLKSESRTSVPFNL